MIILGLTGSIAMGKSTLARQFRQLGIPVCDSDAVVHRLLARNGAAVKKIQAIFPHVVEENTVNRLLLGREVFGNDAKMRQLEAIVHPLVHKEQERFIRKARIHGKSVIVLDIPLLFETHAETRCDYVIVATAPAFLQRQRAFARPNMTPERFEEILARQLPDREKRQRADFIISTGLGKPASMRSIRWILNTISY